jgi:hypothetical protein
VDHWHGRLPIFPPPLHDGSQRLAQRMAGQPD